MSHKQTPPDPTQLFTRYAGNPILTAENWPYPANAVFNAGAVRTAGQTMLLVRVEDYQGMSHLAVARSADGLNNWQIDSSPTFVPDPDNYPEELWGIEDPRVVYAPDLQRFVITYTSYSLNGPLVSLALTDDFNQFYRLGAILPVENKDAAVFPRKIYGKWWLIHRAVPRMPEMPAHIWLASSPDLQHWGNHRILLQARSGGWWDANKIGLGPPPIQTQEGWLILYHGVRMTVSGALYRTGLALLDLEDPTKVIRRSKQWVFGSKEPYERIGDVKDANFPCGAVVDEQSGDFFLYYGAADTSVAVATARLQDLLDFLKHDC